MLEVLLVADGEDLEVFFRKKNLSLKENLVINLFLQKFICASNLMRYV